MPLATTVKVSDWVNLLPERSDNGHVTSFYACLNRDEGTDDDVSNSLDSTIGFGTYGCKVLPTPIPIKME